jgi:hypothetical protein
MSIVDQSSVQLANAAHKIAKERDVSFSEALHIARCECVYSMDDSSAVRQACVAGLQNYFDRIFAGRQEASISASDLFMAANAAGMEIGKLNPGQDLVNGLTACITFLLNSRFAGIGQTAISVASVKDAIKAISDRAAQLYTDALSNKVPQQLGDERRFNEALQLSEGRVLVSTQSVALRDVAEGIAKARNISFCEALPIARRQINMASEVLESAQIKQTVESSLRGYFAKIVTGAQEKVISEMEVFGATEAVAEALSKLKLTSSVTDALKGEVRTVLESYLKKDGEGIVTSSDIESIVAKSANCAASLHAQATGAMRS